MHQSHVPDQPPLQPFLPDSSSAHMSPYQAASLSRKRPLQLEPLHRSTPNTPRAIQPRPPTSGGGPFNGSSSIDSGAQAVQISPDLDTSMSERPRKRGRPSKLETQRRMAEAKVRGEEYPPPKKKTGPKLKNRPIGTSPRITGGGGGGSSGESRGNQLSATTSRLQNAIEMDVRQSPGTLHREQSSTSNRRRKELMDRPPTIEQPYRSAEPQNLRPDPTIGSSPRTRPGGSMYPSDQNMGGVRTIGQDESGGGTGGGGGPLSTPRTILASQMSTQPSSSSYVPSFRGSNEMTSGPNPSVTQGIGSGSPHQRGQSPTVTMAGEYNPGVGRHKYHITPGPRLGGGGGGGGGSGGEKKT